MVTESETVEAERDTAEGVVTERDAEVLKLFCGMHLGVNLWDAQVKALSGSPPSVDSIVHSACKLLGHLATNPEYGRGVQAFPEYIKAFLEEAEAVGDTDTDDAQVLKAALGVRMERQVGSRYFVTARNAGRIFYLRPLAIKFLEASELRKELNGLERDVLANLQSRHGAALLKVDGLFFDTIYADLMCLLKSKKLEKKFLDMNPHYLELMEYLELLSHYPEHILDPARHVFASDPRLYSGNQKVNHRLHKNYVVVRKCLYSCNDIDDEVLEMVKAAAISMADKLQAYKCDQVPG